jgi:predicted nucleotidyltransferase
LNNILQNILKTLAYFDIFNYPLTDEEIMQFLPEKNVRLLFDKSVKKLLEEKKIFKIGEFYSLKNRQSLADRRIDGNNRAKHLLKTARRIAKLLAYFPFVESVCISGSLSKNFADQKSDIDFFIITEANRLWIARSFMHLFKKLSYLAGRQHWFCMNYYIDEIGMEIVEKNIFTAMEIVTLKPMYGQACFKKFIETNSWTTNYFQKTFFSAEGQLKKVFLTRWMEKCLRSGFGDTVEKWLMNLTDKRWKKKARKNRLNDHGGKIAMLVSPHFSKPAPEFFQSKIIKEYELRIHELLKTNRLYKMEL